MKLNNTKGYEEAFRVETVKEETELLRRLEDRGYVWMDCDLPTDWIPSENEMEFPYIVAIGDEDELWVFTQEDFDDFEDENSYAEDGVEYREIC